MTICFESVTVMLRGWMRCYRSSLLKQKKPDHCLAQTPVALFWVNMASISSNAVLNSKASFHSEEPFCPKRALVLTKFSRYEFEKRRHPSLSEEELIKNLEERGSDYQNLIQHHTIHSKNREKVLETLKKNSIETRLVNRFEYTDSNIEWADVVITTGGDGTFLMAASKIKGRNKPLIGINSDPSRSLGYLCLPTAFTEDFPKAIEQLKKGDFRWMFRHRIRITLVGEHAFDPPVELHDQQLQYPEYRFLDHVEDETQGSSAKVPRLDENNKHELPVRALNEVFIGESLSSRVSYYELSIDELQREKLKSSGLTVCTGTGSTSWSFNINKVTEQCVQNLLEIANKEAKVSIPTDDSKLISRITEKFNSSLTFDPTKQAMAYTIRDPVVFGTGFNCKPRGFAKKIEVKSRMFDACLVIDGGLSFIFNDGANATLEILEEDALRTVLLTE